MSKITPINQPKQAKRLSDVLPTKEDIDVSKHTDLITAILRLNRELKFRVTFFSFC